MLKVGFIGLGNMGLPMADNLKEEGLEVAAFDVSDVARDMASRKGHIVAQDLVSTCQDADFVLTMLPNSAIARTVARQALEHMKKGALLIDCSTIDVTSARSIHEMAVQSGQLCLDAPVSGGVGGAKTGTLTFMVGGTDEAFSKGRILLDIMGKKSVHCGEAGSGQAAKVCNNMLLAVSMIGTCEAFALADKLKLDPHRLFDVISTSSGSCWSVNTYCPIPHVGPKSPADNDYKPGFMAALMLKDLNLAMEAVQASGADSKLGRIATQVYQKMNDMGHGQDDFSAIMNHLPQLLSDE